MAVIFNIGRDSFYPALSSIQNVLGKKSSITILENVHISTENESIEMTATDLQMGIKITLPAEIISKGKITIPAKKLFEIVRESGSSHIHIEEKDNLWVNITADQSDYNLAGMSADDYPSFPEYEEDNLVVIESDFMANLIEKTAYSIATKEEDNQFELRGSLLESEKKDDSFLLKMASSDSHRLSLMQQKIDNIGELKLKEVTLIPKTGISEIRKICDNYEKIAIGCDEKQFIVKTENSILLIRLLEGEFPGYSGILEVVSKDNPLFIDKKLFLSALKRINLFSEDEFSTIQFQIEKGKLKLSSESLDYGNGKDEIDIDYNGEKLVLGFNGRYFIDTLQVMKSEKITAYIDTEKSPFMIYGDDDPGFLSIIMPMKL
jgi:DNA polymerase III subunit beta